MSTTIEQMPVSCTRWPGSRRPGIPCAAEISTWALNTVGPSCITRVCSNRPTSLLMNVADTRTSSASSVPPMSSAMVATTGSGGGPVPTWR